MVTVTNENRDAESRESAESIIGLKSDIIKPKPTLAGGRIRTYVY
jgi:hypothetical protein